MANQHRIVGCCPRFSHKRCKFQPTVAEPSQKLFYIQHLVPAIFSFSLVQPSSFRYSSFPSSSVSFSLSLSFSSKLVVQHNAKYKTIQQPFRSRQRTENSGVYLGFAINAAVTVGGSYSNTWSDTGRRLEYITKDPHLVEELVAICRFSSSTIRHEKLRLTFPSNQVPGEEESSVEREGRGMEEKVFYEGFSEMTMSSPRSKECRVHAISSSIS